MSVPLSELETEVNSVDSSQPVAKAIAGRSPGQIAWRRLRHDKVSMVALVIIVLVGLFAIAAPIMKAAGILDPYSFHNNKVGGFGSMPVGKFGGMGWSNLLGVEPGTGRDVFSRVALGISFSLLIATAATLVSVIIGMTVGIIAGYTGKATDFWLSRAMDLVLSFPQLLMLLALSPVLK